MSLLFFCCCFAEELREESCNLLTVNVIARPQCHLDVVVVALVCLLLMHTDDDEAPKSKLRVGVSDRNGNARVRTPKSKNGQNAKALSKCGLELLLRASEVRPSVRIFLSHSCHTHFRPSRNEMYMSAMKVHTHAPTANSRLIHKVSCCVSCLCDPITLFFFLFAVCRASTTRN